MIIGNNRLKVIENIKYNVNNKLFNEKVEIDDPNLTNEQRQKIIDKFLKGHKSLLYFLKNRTAMLIVNVLTQVLNKDTKIIGLEKLKDIENGAIITNNHFNQIDSTISGKMVQLYNKKYRKAKKDKKMFIVTEDTNLAMTGFIRFIMNYANTIPVNNSFGYLKHDFSDLIKNSLNKNNFVLIYAEEEMWFNYKKPRPGKSGAYYYAAKNNVPIISCFTQIIECDEMDNDEFKKVKYVFHILDPIYPDQNKTLKENINEMKEKDYMQKVEAYEKIYKQKLTYDFSYLDIAGLVKHEDEVLEIVEDNL